MDVEVSGKIMQGKMPKHQGTPAYARIKIVKPTEKQWVDCFIFKLGPHLREAWRITALSADKKKQVIWWNRPLQLDELVKGYFDYSTLHELFMFQYEERSKRLEEELREQAAEGFISEEELKEELLGF